MDIENILKLCYQGRKIFNRLFHFLLAVVELRFSVKLPLKFKIRAQLWETRYKVTVYKYFNTGSQI